MKKILTVIGARPQFIKASALSRALADIDGVVEVLVHTGQHYTDTMSSLFFSEMGIPDPAYNLGIGSFSHGKQTGRMLEALEAVMMAEKPDWVIVYGDTNSTLAGALAASKLGIRLAHVEAGLRNYDRRMPEEINRLLTDHLSDRLYAPTHNAIECLTLEGIGPDRVVFSGDVMYDVALHFKDRAERESRILEQYDLKPDGYVLATVHRAENTDNLARLRTIMESLASYAEELPVILPLHPRTKSRLESMGLLDATKRKIRILDPLGYLDMTMLRQNSALVVTDSGGLQKEAFFDRVPSVVLYQATPWVELVDLGWVTVTAAENVDELVATMRSARGRLGREATPYGSGDAARRIAEDIAKS